MYARIHTRTSVVALASLQSEHASKQASKQCIQMPLGGMDNFLSYFQLYTSACKCAIRVSHLAAGDLTTLLLIVFLVSYSSIYT